MSLNRNWLLHSTPGCLPSAVTPERTHEIHFRLVFKFHGSAVASWGGFLMKLIYSLESVYVFKAKAFKHILEPIIVGNRDYGDPWDGVRG